MHSPRLHNKRVLVTGAASGIGLETACAFARRGARLILTDLNGEALARAKARIEQLGVACQAYVCDVADAAAVTACAEQVQAEGGALDILVNNAGIYFLGGFLETDNATWQRMFDVNVLGVLNMTRAFLPAMQAAGGPRRIVNVASLAAFLGAPNVSAYSASKHALLGLSDVLAMELAAQRSEVGVLVVCPGIINTQLLGGKKVGANISPRQPEMQQAYYARHGCHPEVVAEGIAAQVWSTAPYLFVGPKAKLGFYLTRLSRRLARIVSVQEAHKNGYLDPDA